MINVFWWVIALKISFIIDSSGSLQVHMLLTFLFCNSKYNYPMFTKAQKTWLCISCIAICTDSICINEKSWCENFLFDSHKIKDWLQLFPKTGRQTHTHNTIKKYHAFITLYNQLQYSISKRICVTVVWERASVLCSISFHVKWNKICLNQYSIFNKGAITVKYIVNKGIMYSTWKWV